MFLEVERKFCPSAVSLIADNAGHPPFRKLTTLPTSTFTDTYFDTKTLLQRHGMWLRRRNWEWELKIKAGGDYTNSAFQEIKGAAAIERVLKQSFPATSWNLAQLTNHQQDLGTGLTAFAEITTSRQSWTALNLSNDMIEIVVDTTDFGHRVGEVELAWDKVDVTTKEASRLKMDAILAQFMLHHAWAFPKGPCKGKLTAYFEWQKALDKAENHFG